MRPGRIGGRAAFAPEDRGSQADRLDQLLLTSPPFTGWGSTYGAPVSRDEAARGTRSYRETAGMLDGHGFQAGYIRSWTSERSWQDPDGGAVVLYVYEFASTEDALAFDEESVRRACAHAENTFTLHNAFMGAMGLSMREVNAPVTEEVFVRGPRRYVVSLELARHTDFGRIADLAEREHFYSPLATSSSVEVRDTNTCSR